MIQEVDSIARYVVGKMVILLSAIVLLIVVSRLDLPYASDLRLVINSFVLTVACFFLFPQRRTLREFIKALSIIFVALTLVLSFFHLFELYFRS